MSYFFLFLPFCDTLIEHLGSAAVTVILTFTPCSTKIFIFTAKSRYFLLYNDHHMKSHTPHMPLLGMPDEPYIIR